MIFGINNVIEVFIEKLSGSISFEAFDWGRGQRGGVWDVVARWNSWRTGECSGWGSFPW